MQNIAEKTTETYKIIKEYTPTFNKKCQKLGKIMKFFDFKK